MELKPNLLALPIMDATVSNSQPVVAGALTGLTSGPASGNNVTNISKNNGDIQNTNLKTEFSGLLQTLLVAVIPAPISPNTVPPQRTVLESNSLTVNAEGEIFVDIGGSASTKPISDTSSEPLAEIKTSTPVTSFVPDIAFMPLAGFTNPVASNFVAPVTSNFTNPVPLSAHPLSNIAPLYSGDGPSIGSQEIVKSNPVNATSPKAPDSTNAPLSLPIANAALRQVSPILQQAELKLPTETGASNILIPEKIIPSHSDYRSDLLKTSNLSSSYSSELCNLPQLVIQNPAESVGAVIKFTSEQPASISAAIPSSIQSDHPSVPVQNVKDLSENIQAPEIGVKDLNENKAVDPAPVIPAIALNRDPQKTIDISQNVITVTPQKSSPSAINIPDAVAVPVPAAKSEVAPVAVAARVQTGVAATKAVPTLKTPAQPEAESEPQPGRTQDSTLEFIASPSQIVTKNSADIVSALSATPPLAQASASVPAPAPEMAAFGSAITKTPSQDQNTPTFAENIISPLRDYVTHRPAENAVSAVQPDVSQATTTGQPVTDLKNFSQVLAQIPDSTTSAVPNAALQPTGPEAISVDSSNITGSERQEIIRNSLAPAQQRIETYQQTASPPIRDIAVHISQHVDTGLNRFQLRLDPPELGRIDVRMEISPDGKLSAVIAVERPETLDLLQRDQRVLERSLLDAGLKTDSNSLSFSLKDGRNDARQEAGAQNTQATNINPPTDEWEDHSLTLHTAMRFANSAVNIRI